MYIGAVTSAVIGLILRYLLRGRLSVEPIWNMQIALFVVGCAAGLIYDVREMRRKKER